MSIDPEEELEAAWADRRVAFSLQGDEQRVALEGALQRLESASDLLEGEPRRFAHALHLRAHVLADLERHDEAKRMWGESVDILRHAGDPLGLAHKVRHLGDATLRLGERDEARAHFAEALELHRTHGDARSLDLANLLRRMALLEEGAGAHDVAIARWEEARSLYASFDLLEGVDEADAHIASLAPNR
ncbi:MAG: tetratricopeptide repeat protein [Gemmatimonadota bacterium]